MHDNQHLLVVFKYTFIIIILVMLLTKVYVLMIFTF